MVLVDADLPVLVDAEDIPRDKAERYEPVHEVIDYLRVLQVDDLFAQGEDAVQQRSHVSGLLGFEQVEDSLQERLHFFFAAGVLHDAEHAVQVPEQVVFQM